MSISAEQLKFLNAINVLISGKVGSLSNIHEAFHGNFKKAWESDLRGFMPSEGADAQTKINCAKIKGKISPEKEFNILIKENIKLITILDKNYPPLLREIARPPFILYVRGNADVLLSQCFAVVGTRKITDYGKLITPRFAGILSSAGFTVVSGLAKGIDALAHKAATENNGPTIAVLGCGLGWNVFYPSQNKKIAVEIIKNGGAIVSEYGFNMFGSSITFPQRNRIISGLSKGVLVVEADIQSGALITARFAVEQNRDVFCVPGSIFSEMSKGTNLYIQKGAKPVTDAKEILTDYGISYNDTNVKIVADNEIEEKIIKIISKNPAHVDEIIRQSGQKAATIQSNITIMELKGKIINLGGGRYAAR